MFWKKHLIGQRQKYHHVNGCGPKSADAINIFRGMDNDRVGFIRSVLRLLGVSHILLWIHNLADPNHPDFVDTLPPHLWGQIDGRCVRCGVRSPGHIVGSFGCNLLRAAEAFFGIFIHFNMLKN